MKLLVLTAILKFCTSKKLLTSILKFCTSKIHIGPKIGLESTRNSMYLDSDLESILISWQEIQTVFGLEDCWVWINSSSSNVGLVTTQAGDQ